MTTERLSGPNPRRKLFLYAAASMAALVAYTSAVAYILAHSTAKVYGFPISFDIRTLVEIALQVCPMLAAIFMVLLSPLRDQLIQGIGSSRAARTVMNVAVNLLIAVITTLATASAIYLVVRPAPASMSFATLLWVAGEFIIDVTLIGIFTTTLYALTRRLWLTAILFVGYVVVVIVAGLRWDITSYIGFGSGVPVMLTTYSVRPLYDGAGWLFRGYWTCVAALLLAVLYAFDNPPRPLLMNIPAALQGTRKPVYTCLALFVVCILACAGLVRLQQFGIAKYQAPSRAALDRALGDDRAATTRLHLTRYDVRLTYSPQDSAVAVDGVLTFRNEMHPVQTAYFQMPAPFVPDQLQIDGVGKYELQRLGKYIKVSLAESLQPGMQARIKYGGVIRPAGHFDLAVQAKILDGAFFLTDSDILLTARSAACIDAAESGRETTASKTQCGSAENFLLSDMASGTTTVIAPRRFEVIGAGEESRKDLDENTVGSIFTTSSPRLATFMVACAPFATTKVESKDGGPAIHVHRSQAAVSADAQGTLAQSVLSFYSRYWPTYARGDLHIVETPTPVGEALAFDGAIAISDKIISSRDPVSGKGSNLLEFVMAHEIAHQWWGYGVVPARSPGWRFVLESFPQFAAYKYLDHRGLLKEQDAMSNEKRRYEAARARLRNQDLPLLQVEAPNELAYNKGPLALMTLDGLHGHSLMNRLGDLMKKYSHEFHGNTDPEHLVATMIEQLPQGNRETARPLFYSVGYDAK